MIFGNFKKGVGVDIVDTSRFEQFKLDKEHNFLKKTFTSYELNYCYLNKEVAPHLAGLFAAKEATSKALGVKKYPFIEIEIRHDIDGKPIAFNKGKKLPVAISVSHTKATAIAVAMC